MFKKILIALDPINPDRDCFENTLALADAVDAELLLLSVLAFDGEGMLFQPHPQVVGYSDALNDWNLFQKCYEEYKQSSLKVIGSLTHEATAAGVRAKFTQSSGLPGREICKLAKAKQADLIVVGRRGYRGFDKMLLGSVSNYVAHHAPCSVMVVHARKDTKPQTQASIQATPVISA